MVYTDVSDVILFQNTRSIKMQSSHRQWLSEPDKSKCHCSVQVYVQSQQLMIYYSCVIYLEAQFQAPGNKLAQGKILQTYLSSLRQERDGRAGVLVCLAVQSN